MAAHLTFPSTRLLQDSWFASIVQIGALGSTILESLGEFGLAANGMCPTVPVQDHVSRGWTATEGADEPKQ